MPDSDSLNEKSKIIVQAVKCPNCAANLNLNESNGVVKCSYCGGDIVISNSFRKDAAEKTARFKIDPKTVTALKESAIACMLLCLLAIVFYGANLFINKNMAPIPISGVPFIKSVLPLCDFKTLTVTVAGSGFGNSAGIGGIYLDGSAQSEIIRWSDNEIVFKMPYNGTSGNLSVKCGDYKSNDYRMNLPLYKFATKWGKAGANDAEFKTPYGIAINSGRKIYVSDYRNHRIQVFDETGRFLFSFGRLGSGPGEFNLPSRISISKNDRIYVADTGNDRVEVFEPDGRFVKEFGSHGNANGCFNGPTGVAIDGQENIYVTDFKNRRIQKFDREFRFVTEWGSYGSGNCQFGAVYSLAIDGEGNVVILDNGNYSVKKFDPSGKFISKFGKQGARSDEFVNPSSISIDGAGNFFITDIVEHSIQVFEPTGKLIVKFKSPGSSDGQFNQPCDIAIDSDNNIYIDDYVNCRIQCFSRIASPTWFMSPLYLSLAISLALIFFWKRNLS